MGGFAVCQQAPAAGLVSISAQEVATTVGVSLVSVDKAIERDGSTQGACLPIRVRQPHSDAGFRSAAPILVRREYPRTKFMPPADHHRVLFEPITIGPKTLRNRFYNVPHGTAYGVLRPSTWASYRAVRAEGGWAVVSTEFSGVSPSTDEYPLHSSDMWDSEDARRHKLMVDAVHEHGALASIELHHGGAHAMRRISREPALSASGLAHELPPPAGLLGTPKIMTFDDIERTEQAFVAAAVRARDAGYDIITVLAGYGYLFAQFLSPFHNHRTDKYGGSLENRARFWTETLERVRDAVGKDCAIATRLSIETQGPWGHSIDDSVALVELADPLVDLWDLNVGSVLDWASDISPSRLIPEGSNLGLFERVRHKVDAALEAGGLWLEQPRGFE